MARCADADLIGRQKLSAAPIEGFPAEMAHKQRPSACGQWPAPQRLLSAQSAAGDRRRRQGVVSDALGRRRGGALVDAAREEVFAGP
jgi:hypothetical protein